MKSTIKVIGEVHTFLDSFTKGLGKNKNQRKTVCFVKIFTLFKTVAAIAVGSLIYSIALHYFIFPHDVLLGGAGGVSVLLSRYVPGLSAETYLVIINTALMAVALLVLGKNMAGKTMLGSIFTTLFVGALDSICNGHTPLVENVFISAILGAMIVAVGSTILFAMDSSSGGTDIIALIIKKYSRISIGKALLMADILIVVMGILSFHWTVAVGSVIGLLIKTFGIDFLIHWYSKKISKAK